MNTYEQLLNHQTKLSVIGLGYVGLPIALEFAKTIDVIGFDIKPDRVEMMKNNIDPSDEIPSSEFLTTIAVIKAYAKTILVLFNRGVPCRFSCSRRN